MIDNRRAQILKQTTKVLENQRKTTQWLKRKNPTLGNQRPIDLLDTESGYRLVKQAFLQIEHGISGYGTSAN